MSQNPTAVMHDKKSPVQAGLDIAQASLQLHLQGRFYDLPNTAEGHAQMRQRLATVPDIHIVCEATGGYERAVVAALHAAPQPVSVNNPARVRQFARASGELAKTDPIAAAVLTAFGVAFQPEATPARTATENKLAALVARRAQMIERRVAEAQRADTCPDLVSCPVNNYTQRFSATLAECHDHRPLWRSFHRRLND